MTGVTCTLRGEGKLAPRPTGQMTGEMA